MCCFSWQNSSLCHASQILVWKFLHLERSPCTIPEIIRSSPSSVVCYAVRDRRALSDSRASSSSSLALCFTWWFASPWASLSWRSTADSLCLRAASGLSRIAEPATVRCESFKWDWPESYHLYTFHWFYRLCLQAMRGVWSGPFVRPIGTSICRSGSEWCCCEVYRASSLWMMGYFLQYFVLNLLKLAELLMPTSWACASNVISYHLALDADLPPWDSFPFPFPA